MNAELTPHVLFAKAARAAASARALLELGDTDGACNRAYYAMFDAARALLLATGEPVEAMRTHSGVMTRFGLRLVKPGKVTHESGRLLKRAEEIRLVADYRGDSIEPGDAHELVNHAGLFLAELRPLIDG